jgi:hypothetical protein
MRSLRLSDVTQGAQALENEIRVCLLARLRRDHQARDVFENHDPRPGLLDERVASSPCLGELGTSIHDKGFWELGMSTNDASLVADAKVIGK